MIIVDTYTYKCTIDTPSYTDRVHFNKQSNFAYCGSTKSYKLIDCNDDKSKTSKIFESMLVNPHTLYDDLKRKIHYKIIIYVGTHVIITHNNNAITRYVLKDNEYIDTHLIQLKYFQSACVYNDNLYVCTRECRGSGYLGYNIIMFDINTLEKIQMSPKYCCTEVYTCIYISIHNDIITICEARLSQTQ